MLKLLTMTAMLGLVGCVGDIQGMPDPGDNPNPNPNPPPPTGTARAAFESDVYPIVSAKCIGCHQEGAVKSGAPATSDFVAPQLTGAYDHIVDYPNVHGNFASTAKILVYVTQQGHQGISYTGDQVAAIENWLALELAERAGGPGTGTGDPEGPGATTERVLAAFSACSTQELFDQAGMAQACGALETQNNAECDNCHVNGGERHLANRVSTLMFPPFVASRTYIQKYFMVAGAETPTTAKMASNIPMFQAVLSRTGMYLEHPTVNNGTPDNNECTQAMATYLGLVQAKIDAGSAACGPSKLVD